MITEADPPCLPYLLGALSHPSFGVRSAACQLTRALSRTVSLVRTSLIDCGISEEVINTLIREVSDRNQRDRQVDAEGPWDERGLEGAWTDRDYIVEISAMMTLCNLIADFSPLKEVSHSRAHQEYETDCSETPRGSRYRHDMRSDAFARRTTGPECTVDHQECHVQVDRDHEGSNFERLRY